LEIENLERANISAAKSVIVLSDGANADDSHMVDSNAVFIVNTIESKYQIPVVSEFGKKKLTFLLTFEVNEKNVQFLRQKTSKKSRSLVLKKKKETGKSSSIYFASGRVFFNSVLNHYLCHVSVK
jgi:hypothetical protein